MGRSAFLMPMLYCVCATQALAASAPPKPDWDCDVEVTEGGNHWNAYAHGVTWHRFTAEGAYSAVYLFASEAPTREALRRHGPFDPALRASLSVAPPTTRAKQQLWVSISAGQQVLAPRRVGSDKGFYASANLPLFEVEPLLAAEQLIVTFYYSDGTILNRTAIPSADIVAAVSRFPELLGRYEARAAQPEGVCRDRNDDIVIVD